jgi:GH25 family lysozyme M1 (1,4-beta-N-acetylmuramidase)
MNTNGKYPLRIVVSDASGNKTDFDMTIKVNDSVPPGPDTSERVKFGDFVESHKGDKKLFGIDISSWQGEVDFEKVRDAGCEFVMIRLGYSSDGEVTIDSKFDENIAGARAAGLKIGVYLYSYDNNEEDVRASAEQLLEKLDGAELDLPVAFDWEDFTHFQTYGMSFDDLNGLYDVFEKEIRLAGYNCMLYGSMNYLEKVWKDTDKRPIWVASYGKHSGYEGPRVMWQAANTGRIDGISGDVDIDLMYQ